MNCSKEYQRKEGNVTNRNVLFMYVQYSGGNKEERQMVASVIGIAEAPSRFAGYHSGENLVR